MKKNRTSKNWINKQKRDIYVRKSKIEGYRSRAVYKLEEINNKFKFLKNNIYIVDLGSAPGSWSQYVSRNFKNIKLIAIDLKEMDHIDNIKFIKGDFTEEDKKDLLINYFGDKIDLVLSDMAVNTTGIKNVDSIVTGDLCMEALDFSIKMLKNKGCFVSKLFMGPSFNEIVALSKQSFKEVYIFKPPSSRKDSKENFIICKNLR